MPDGGPNFQASKAADPACCTIAASDIDFASAAESLAPEDELPLSLSSWLLVGLTRSLRRPPVAAGAVAIGA